MGAGRAPTGSHRLCSPLPALRHNRSWQRSIGAQLRQTESFAEGQPGQSQLPSSNDISGSDHTVRGGAPVEVFTQARRKLSAHGGRLLYYYEATVLWLLLPKHSFRSPGSHLVPIAMGISRYSPHLFTVRPVY